MVFFLGYPILGYPVSPVFLGKHRLGMRRHREIPTFGPVPAVSQAPKGRSPPSGIHTSGGSQSAPAASIVCLKMRIR